MKIDGAILVANPSEAGPAARRLEELGYDGGFSFEGPHDPFLPLCVAAEHTERLELATAIAIAFARNPMTLEMAVRIDDALLERIAVVGATDEVPDRIRARCEHFADRVSLVAPTTPEPERWAHVVRALHG